MTVLARADDAVDDSTTPIELDIDRSVPIPIYHQLALAFEKAILRGDLAPGERLENELLLSRRLNISRITIRHAMAELVDRGVVIRRRGVGTQVVHHPIRRSTQITSVFDLLEAAGKHPSTRVLEYDLTCADPEVKTELAVSADVEVVRIKRLRIASREPHSLMINWLPAQICPSFDDLEQGGLYAALRAKGIHISLAREKISARVADESEAALLDLPPSSPLLCLRRMAIDDDGRVVEVGEHVFRPDRYTYDTTVVRR
ncbi:GntR family transcriptional regulator [Gordonia sp. NPDC003424]